MSKPQEYLSIQPFLTFRSALQKNSIKLDPLDEFFNCFLLVSTTPFAFSDYLSSICDRLKLKSEEQEQKLFDVYTLFSDFAFQTVEGPTAYISTPDEFSDKLTSFVKEFAKLYQHEKKHFSQTIYIQCLNLCLKVFEINGIDWERTSKKKSMKILTAAYGKHGCEMAASLFGFMSEYTDEVPTFRNAGIAFHQMLLLYMFLQDQSMANLMDEVREEAGYSLIPETRTNKGRNAPCPCGSGKKYKKCCLNAPPPNSYPETDTIADPPPTATNNNIANTSPTSHPNA